MLPLPKARGDLEYFERTIEGDDVVLIRDPIRGNYIRFNPLQAAMLRALDGHRTPVEITATLAEQYEVEIPPEAAERFIARARDLMLLDIAAYTTTSSAARKEVRKAMRKAGFRSPAAPEGPARSRDGIALAEAFRQLDLGHPRAAAAHLARILAHDPDHARARQLHALIQTAYLRAAGRTTDFPTWVLFNPSRLLTWLSRTIGRFLFGWVGVLAILAFYCVGAYAYTQVSFEHIELGAFDILVAVVMITTSKLCHEAGHGLACQHYGGNVTEIGFTLFYYLQPAAYCDTSSSYTITERRHLVIIQLAGVIVSLLFISGYSILLMLLRPSVAIYSGLSLGLLLTGAVAFLTLIPLVKFDGYYALCDLLGFPNLRDRAFKLTRAWLSERLLGIPQRTEELPPRTRVLMIAYGVLAFLFTAWFLYFAYARLLAPLVERLRGAGLMLAIGLGAYFLRNLTLRPVWSLARLLVRERRRIFTRRRTAVLAAVVALVVGPWCIHWPVLVDESFVLVPQQRADVRARVAGRVEQIFVEEGDRVRRGQPVAILRNAALHAQIEALAAELEAASHRLERLRRGARTEELALARRRLDHARSEAALGARATAIATDLAAAALGTEASADVERRRLAGEVGAANAARWQLSLLEAGARPQDIEIAEAECARLTSQLAKLRGDEALLTLRSPIDGVVVTPHLTDRLQAMLAPGEQLAEVHDLSAMVAEIALSPGDPLAEIAVGDEVALRPHGTPGSGIATRIARLREATQDAGGERRVVAVTAPFSPDRPIAGLTGHARVYGADHSLAYANLYLPLQRLLRVQLWSRW